MNKNIVCFKNFSPDYQSFGFLPALDHISVYADICKRFQVKPKKNVFFGQLFFLAGDQEQYQQVEKEI